MRVLSAVAFLLSSECVVRSKEVQYTAGCRHQALMKQIDLILLTFTYKCPFTMTQWLYIHIKLFTETKYCIPKKLV